MQRAIWGIARLSLVRPGGILAGTVIRVAISTRFRKRSNRYLPTRSVASLAVTASTSGPTDTFLHTDNDLLVRARRYGIFTLDDLQHQSNLYSTKGRGTCLVDKQFRSDLQLWDILLDYQLQHFGLKGAKTIWRGMKYRGKPVKLESEDELTTAVWQKLLFTAVESRDLSFVKLLCEGDGLAWNRPKLFTEVVGALLNCDQEYQAAYMCFYLRKKQKSGQGSILDLYKTFRPQDHAQLKQFSSFYFQMPGERIYDEAIRNLWEEERVDDAFLLHKFLIARGDLPSSFNELKPFMFYLARKHHDPSPFIRQLITAGAMFSNQARNTYKEELDKVEADPSRISQPLVRPHWEPPSKKKVVTDTFAARAFATKALSFDFVLNSLRLFGLTEIGPQSMREIGLAASTPEIFASRLTRLDEVGVDTGSSAFSRLVRKLCFTGQHSLWKESLKTTMHHELFEDTALQQKLLSEHFNKSDWKSVNLLLTMLNNGDVEGKGGEAHKHLLEITSEDHSKQRALLGLLFESAPKGVMQGINLHSQAIDRLSTALRNGRAQDVSKTSISYRAQFLAGLMQDAVALGKPVHGHQWRLVLSRFGKAGNFREVISLSLWLAEHYSSQRIRLLQKSHLFAAHTLNLAEFFNVKYQAAIIVWALRRDVKAGFEKTSWQNVRKALTLLKHLEHRYKIATNLPTVRKALVVKFRTYDHEIRVRSMGLNKERSTPNLTKALINLLRIVNEIWTGSGDVVDKEIKVALHSLRTKKMSKDRMDRRFGKKARALMQRSEAKRMEDIDDQTQVAEVEGDGDVVVICTEAFHQPVPR